MNKILQPIQNENGMSLLSALMGVAISVVVALGMASIAHNMSRVQETAKARENASSTMFLITSFLQDRDICKKSLLGSGVKLPVIDKGQSIKTITSKDGKQKLFTLKSGDGISKMVLEPVKEDVSLARMPVAQGRYLAQLKVEFFQKDSLMGGGVAPRTIPVFLSLDETNTAVDCRAVSDNETDGVVDDLETLISSPHMNPLNCQGQYFPLPKGRSPSSVSDLRDLKPVDPASRFKLLSKTPPYFINTIFPKAAAGYEAMARRPVVQKKFSTPVELDGSKIRKMPDGFVKDIDGQRYFVSSTIGNGTTWGKAGDSGCGIQHACNAGILTSGEAGESCGGGHR